MRKGAGRIIALTVIGILAFAVGMAQAQSKPIKIGQIIAMTGEAAESGKYHKQGAELAVDQDQRRRRDQRPQDPDRSRGRPDHQSRRGGGASRSCWRTRRLRR